jgi:uncharacterized Zn-finger protein
MPSADEVGVLNFQNLMDNYFFEPSQESQDGQQQDSLTELNHHANAMLNMKPSLYTDTLLHGLSIQPQQSGNFYDNTSFPVIPMLQTTPNLSSDDERMSALWGSLESASEFTDSPRFGSNITPPDSSYDSFTFGDNGSSPFSPDVFLMPPLDNQKGLMPFSGGRARSNSALSLLDESFSDSSFLQSATPKRQRSASNPNPDKKKKTFYCHLCPTTFSRNHDLKRHIRIHLGIRPHKCQTCPKTFTRADALHRHVHIRGCRGM